MVEEPRFMEVRNGNDVKSGNINISRPKPTVPEKN